MSAADIQDEVGDAFAEVAQEVGDGEFSVTLIRPVTKDTPWDYDNPDKPPEWTLRAMVDSWKAHEINGETIRATDLKVMIKGGVVQPQTGDRLVMNGNEYTVIPVDNAAFAGVPLYHVIGARK